MEGVLWIMDSDCCEMCGGLLDYFGQCPHCDWDSVYGYDWDDTTGEEDYYADWYEDEADY